MKSQDIEDMKNGKPVKDEITPLQFGLILVSIACCGISGYLGHKSIQEMEKLQQANQPAKEVVEEAVKEDAYYEPLLPETIVYQGTEEKFSPGISPTSEATPKKGHSKGGKVEPNDNPRRGEKTND